MHCLSEHYARIWEYGGEIIKLNLDSTKNIGVDIKEDGSDVFKRLYVCSKAIKDGWVRGCRRVIELDGCFLKRQCKGELLTAMGRDGKNQVYPIAWAMIDVEKKDNWEWSINLLVEDLCLELGEGLAIIFDLHKALVGAVKEKLPLVEHRQCAIHVYVNFKKTMEELKEMNRSAYEHFMARNLEIILEARTKPLLTMLEELEMYVMEWFYRMSIIRLTCRGDVCPTLLTKLDDRCKDMRLFTNMYCMTYRLWSVVASDTKVFEVRLGFESFQVDLGEKFCTCRLWEISGIPCVHACATMNHTQQ
uniref:SWIM-type domain-containing protein n=1 Tax=Lactuca sativa TaxID=4236 RepID=A0A9R1WW11_LACSA|nr:hypothetical protein LSAT_V11C800395300 [Lactuca sativa]